MKKTISFTFEEEMIDELKDISEEENINLSGVARDLFREWIITREDDK